MRWLILALCLFLGASAQANFTQVAVNGSGSVGGACWTTGSDGWTVQCSTAITSGTCTQAGARNANGTCFVAVSSSGGNDGTCDSFTTQAAAVAAPCLHINTACNLIRNPSADHFLFKKGDTWTLNGTTETADCLGSLKFAGISATQPAAILAYGTGARPKIITNHASGNGSCIGSSLGSGRTATMGNNIAIIGLECYNAERDPNNGAFNPDPLLGVAGSGFTMQNSYDSFLVEDFKSSFYQNCYNLDASSLNGFTHHNTRIRRSIFVDCYSTNNGHAQGGHAALNFGTFLFEENLVDNGGCLCAGTASAVMNPITATITIASPAVVTAAFPWPMFESAGMSFHANSDSLPTGLTTGVAYSVMNHGVAGANTFWLSSDYATVITASIDNCTPSCGSGSAGNTLSITAVITNSGIVHSGQTVVGAGVTAVQLTTSCLSNCQSDGRGTYTVGGAAQLVTSETMTLGTVINTSGSQSGTHKIAWDVPGASPMATAFNHCLYFDANNDPATLHGNILTNCSDNANQGRAGGTMTSNYIAQSPEAGFSTTWTGNVIDGPAGWSCNGLACPTENNGPTLNSSTNGVITGNTFSNAGNAGQQAIGIQDSHDDCGRISVSIGSPAVVMFFTGRVFENQAFAFSATNGVFDCDGTGTLPTGLSLGTTYFIINNKGPWFDTDLGTTSGTTAVGNATLNFSSVPFFLPSPQALVDITNPTAIPPGTLISSTTSTTVVLNANVASPGVGNGDHIVGCPATPIPVFAFSKTPSACNWSGNITATNGGTTPINTSGTEVNYFAPLYYAYNNSITNNVIYNFGNATGNANLVDSSANSGTNTISGNSNFNSGGGSFPGCGGSPNNCTAGNYNAQLSDCASLPAGCTATLTAFLTNVRAQSKDNWRDELMAKSVGTWIRAGFGQGAIN